jgi:hypothetical protein
LEPQQEIGSEPLILSERQLKKIGRLIDKVKKNDTVTIKKEEEASVYFHVVKSHFESPDGGNSVRLEGLGCAVVNVVAVANLLSSAGVAII